MELEDAVDSVFAEANEGRGRRTGHRHWAIFCAEMGWELRLINPEHLLGARKWKAIMAAERKLLLFMQWLDRSYAVQTIYKYVGDVKALQVVYNGLPFASMDISFMRLPLLFKAIKKAKPPTQKEKTPWEYQLFDQQRRGQGVRSGLGIFKASTYRRTVFSPFMKETVMCVQALAFEQLLRLSELVRTSKATNADTFPLTWEDIKFEAADGSVITWRENGTIQGTPVMAVLRVPPNKKQRVGTGVLKCPFPQGWEVGSSPNAAGPMLWRYANRYPVARTMAGVTPLFRNADPQTGNVAGRLTQTKFSATFRQLCHEASPQIDAKVFGIHCYRVGGMNRLMDLGATVPQICALGRWKSDCWTVYARRHRDTLWELTERMFRSG